MPHHRAASLRDRPMLRAEIDRALPGVPEDFRRELVRTATLSEREAMRLLERRAAETDGLDPEAVETARRLIERYASAA